MKKEWDRINMLDDRVRYIAEILERHVKSGFAAAQQETVASLVNELCWALGQITEAKKQC